VSSFSEYIVGGGKKEGKIQPNGEITRIINSGEGWLIDVLGAVELLFFLLNIFSSLSLSSPFEKKMVMAQKRDETLNVERRG
jgi:hypothetical protein